jgi:hypothetical protein
MAFEVAPYELFKCQVILLSLFEHSLREAHRLTHGFWLVGDITSGCFLGFYEPRKPPEFTGKNRIGSFCTYFI